MKLFLRDLHTSTNQKMNAGNAVPVKYLRKAERHSMTHTERRQSVSQGKQTVTKLKVLMLTQGLLTLTCTLCKNNHSHGLLQFPINISHTYICLYCG